MDGDYDDPGTDNTLGRSDDAADRWISADEHQSLAHIDWRNAITSRDIDVLVQLKLLRKAL